MADQKPDSFGEEVSAFGQRVKGAAKDATGALTGNESLEREGERENAAGRARQHANDAIGDHTRAPSGSIREEGAAFGERMKGAAKDAAGAVLGDERLEREGEMENARGRARQNANNAVGSGRSFGSASTEPYYRPGYVTGLYRTPADAGRAFDSLTREHGYEADDIDVLMSDETRKRHFGDVKPGEEFTGGTKAAEGAGKGGAIGGGIGAALAAIFAVGTSIVVPGLGLVVAGPIAAALAGAGAGSVTGGIIGALVGAGIPEDRAKVYESGINQGGVVVGTRARDDRHAENLRRDFANYGGTDVLG